MFFVKQPLQYFPNPNDNSIYFYNDSIDKGKSIITSSRLTDSLVSMNYFLKEGFLRPYAGIGFAIKNKNDIDISQYNRVKIDVSGTGIRSVFMYIVLKNISVVSEGRLLTSIQLSKYIEIDEKRRSFKLSMSDFIAPDWWFDKYNVSPATIKKPDCSKMEHVDLVTGLNPAMNEEQSITVYSIVFYNDTTRVILFMILAQIVIIGGTMWRFYNNINSEKKPNTVTINYNAVKLEADPSSKKDYLDFINENFHNSDLSLQLIAEETGVSQRKIAENISSRFNCNVKTYINQIRIAEAQRLLRESNLRFSEIAYKVGFSSPSNFNRVYKNLTGTNPSEFLKTGK